MLMGKKVGVCKFFGEGSYDKQGGGLRMYAYPMYAVKQM